MIALNKMLKKVLYVEAEAEEAKSLKKGKR
jgi:hypothetical protein